MTNSQNLEASQLPIRERINKLADQLFHDGGRPTVDNIREILKTGSRTTIADELNKWWKNTGHKHKQLLDLPGIPEKLKSEFSALWATALAEAKKQWDLDRGQYLQHIAELETRLHDLGESLNGIEARAVSAEKMASDERLKTTQLTYDLEQLNVKAQEALRAYEDNLSDKENKIAVLSGKIENITDQAENNRIWQSQRIEEARLAEKSAKADRDQAHREASESGRLLRSELKRLTANNGEQNGVIVTLKEELNKRDTEILVLRKAVSINEKNAAAAIAQATLLQSAKHALEKALKSAQRQQPARNRSIRSGTAKAAAKSK